MNVSNSLKHFSNNDIHSLFSFSSCCNLAFYLIESSLLVIMEYVLLNQEETTLSLELA